MQASAATPLPRGPHKLSRAEVWAHQRERILRAIIDAIAEKGYAATTIEDITRRARTSRESFYELFAGKEECFLAAYDLITRELLDELVAIGRSQPGFVEGMRDGVRASLRFWQERPPAARAWLVEILAASPRCLARRDDSLRRFERLFSTVAERAHDEHPGLPALPEVLARAIIAGSFELIAQYVRRGRLDALDELEDPILYLWLMGMASHDVATAALTTGRQGP